ncbi:MAG: hypothetical protein JWN71_1242, partial [Xanthobacteraceae bacterium]|nr:hypothetical protein [Xanthobacteraceae bacterium]
MAALLSQMGEAFWVFDVSPRGEVRNYRLLGRLDPKLSETLGLINSGKGFDAATLWESAKS